MYHLEILRESRIYLFWFFRVAEHCWYEFISTRTVLSLKPHFSKLSSRLCLLIFLQFFRVTIGKPSRHYFKNTNNIISHTTETVIFM